MGYLPFCGCALLWNTIRQDVRARIHVNGVFPLRKHRLASSRGETVMMIELKKLHKKLMNVY